jgi:hypothetical protein
LDPFVRRLLGAGKTVVLNEHKDYLTKLRHAEAMARQCPNGSFERESWLKISEGYRALIEGKGVASLSGKKRPDDLS